CGLPRAWPRDERFELAAQIRRSSNSAPANLAEKHSDRHVRNQIEGANRARGEALETVHHPFIARMKGYLINGQYEELRAQYLECVRMLNGLERTLERSLPPDHRRWPAHDQRSQSPIPEPDPRTLAPDPRTLNPES
ncbi:MAG: four helix bundle protein, partial [Planctomycetes bacterium]|nr:four helix bundle protein [Planctomycetota bacterium]